MTRQRQRQTVSSKNNQQLTVHVDGLTKARESLAELRRLIFIHTIRLTHNTRKHRILIEIEIEIAHFKLYPFEYTVGFGVDGETFAGDLEVATRSV